MMPTGWQLAVIALLIVLLFGAAKLPKLAKSMGQSMRIFKSEVKTMRDDDGGDSGQDSSQDSRRDSSRDSTDQAERPAVEGTVVPEDPPASEQSAERRQHRDHS